MGRRGHVGEDDAARDVLRRERPGRPAAQRHPVRQADRGKAAHGLVEGARVEVEGEDRAAVEGGPGLGEQPRAAADVEGRAGGQVLHQLEAHLRGRVIARPEALAGGLHELAHAGRRGGVGGAAPVPAGQHRRRRVGPAGHLGQGAHRQGAGRERRARQLGRAARRADQARGLAAHRLQGAEGAQAAAIRCGSASTRSPAGSAPVPLTWPVVAITDPSPLVARAARPSRGSPPCLSMSASRAARAHARRSPRRASGSIDAAVAEAGQPRRFARREMASALGLLDALPDLAAAIRPVDVPAVSGSTRLEWAPYGVVLGWHAANSPVWVPTLVAGSALAAGNAVVCRPSSRVRRTTGLVLDALAGAWPEDALVVADLPGPEAEPLVWDPGVGLVVAHASSATCKRHLAGPRARVRGGRAPASRTSPRARATTR